MAVSRKHRYLDGSLPVREDAPAARARRLPQREALIHALFDGLSEQDRAWVIERMRHYRRLAAAEQVSEGRL